MRASAVFRGIHWAVTGVLLIVVVGYIWVSSGDRKANDTFNAATQVRPGLWLYSTQNSSGNATVPTVIRYYLAAKLPGEPADIVKQLHDKMPFMEGTGEITSVSSEKDRLRIVYHGRVYNLDPSVTYQNDGKSVTVHLSYKIEPSVSGG